MVIPLHQLKAVNPSSSRSNTSEKYIQVISIDNHEFWFMGFLNYSGAVKVLQDALEGRILQSAWWKNCLMVKFLSHICTPCFNSWSYILYSFNKFISSNLIVYRSDFWVDELLSTNFLSFNILGFACGNFHENMKLVV